MENEPDLYAYNLTLKVIFLVSLILVILDLIQLFDIFDSIIKAYEKYPKEIFNQCIKYQKIGDLFFSFFGVFSGLSATILSLGLVINIEIFTNKFFDIFIYYNYVIFGPYLLASCFLCFYFFKEVSFTCSRKNYQDRIINFSTVICVLFSLSFSLIVTIVGSVIYSVKLVMESIGSDTNGNYFLGRMFWAYIFRKHNNNNINVNNNNGNNNNGNNNNVGYLPNPINEDLI